MAISKLSKESFFYNIPKWGKDLSLPPEILMQIFQYLDVKSAVFFGRTCKALYQLSESFSLWKYFCVRDFFSSISLENRSPKPEDFNWKAYYRQLESYLNVPFPGKIASFKLKPTEDWRVYFTGGTLIRKLSFESETKDSFFTKFSLLGYENGKIAISIKILNEIDGKNYFKKLSFDLLCVHSIGRNFYFSEFTDLIKIFHILNEFNQIPGDYLGLIKQLIYSGNWKFVMPLTLEESKKLEADEEAYLESFKPKGWKEWLFAKLLWPWIRPSFLTPN